MQHLLPHRRVRLDKPLHRISMAVLARKSFPIKHVGGGFWPLAVVVRSGREVLKFGLH